MPGGQLYKTLSSEWTIESDETFDLICNPYLKEDPRPKEKLHYDWILHKDKGSILGKEMIGNKSLIASDHYGLMVHIKC